MKLSLTDGVAFIDIGESSTLTSRKGCKIVVTSVTDPSQYAVGYIKSAGSTESYSDVIGGTDTNLGNGDFETWADSTNAGTWTETLTGSSTVNQSEDEHGGFYCAKLDVVDGSGVDIRQTVAYTTGGLYYYSYWYKVSGSTFKVVTSGADELNGLIYHGSLTQTGYTNMSGYRVARSIDDRFMFRRVAVSGNYSGYLDDVILKKVTAPGATGVTIVSSMNGATQNWASNTFTTQCNDSAGFTYNIYTN